MIQNPHLPLRIVEARFARYSIARTTRVGKKRLIATNNSTMSGNSPRLCETARAVPETPISAIT
jgi:hypothetical protein